MKILLATQKPFAAAAVAGIREIVEAAGHELVAFEKYAEQSDLVAVVADADAMIIRSDKVTAEVLDAAKRLKIVVRAGAGYDNVDLAAATAHGVVVENTPGQNSNAVAELAIALMIFMARTQFTPATGSEIQGKTLGIQAFGNVGRLVGRKAAALGMKVKAIDPFLPDEKIVEGGAASRSDLRERDIITKFDGQTVKTGEELQKMLTYYRGGETVTLTVQSLEGGKYVERQVEVTLGLREETQNMSQSSTEQG